MTEFGTRQQEADELVLPAFGVIEPERVLVVDELFAVAKDRFPVTPGHTLIIPRRAVLRFAYLNASERARLLEMVVWTQRHLSAISPTPEGYNLGVNDGKAAGQTIAQFHFHVIPR
jgi:diadenosine tetraphosphate (Ap4A) HIT family hydrolase